MPARTAALRSKKVPSEPKEDDVRARVLEAAAVLIDEGGLASLSMREVARRAGISHQAPYHYFADRESILAELAKAGFELLDRRLIRCREETPPGTPAFDRLARAGEVYVEFAVAHPAYFRVMFRPDFVEVGRFPETKACGGVVFQKLVDIVQACVEEGLPPIPNARALVVLGWSVVHGLACLVLDGPMEMKLEVLGGKKPELVREAMQAFRAMMEASAGKRARTGKKHAS